MLMLEILQDVFTRGLEGLDSHINPEKALLNVDAELAKKKIEKFHHSIWDLLHHMDTWQNVVIESIEGKDIDWEDISKNKNWPTEESKNNSKNFERLMTSFLEGTNRVKQLIKSTDLAKPIPSWRDVPALTALMVVITHNSYHLGQIMVLKKNLLKEEGSS